ncbi:MAG: CDP-diacylglycerol--glycerol-3-phosphate 3-phosphatidyltransferase [bacterium]|nr:CDP-diacylglycerol--glycerol-3-phosphate 3-phosphatidyltransferase [bacterium]
MNLANKLTFSRIIAIPFIMVALLLENVTNEFNIHNQLLLIISKYFALFIFIAATLTDLYDGRIARQRKMVTPFGSFFDPIADKLLISTVFICFVELRLMPAWMVVIIIAREFIITGLRVLGAKKNEVIPAGPLGKYKTLSQMVTTIVVLAYLVVRDTLKMNAVWSEKLDAWIYLGIYMLMLWTVFATVISGISYIKHHRHLIREVIE